MPWVKLDDDFYGHPKILKAGPLACWLHTCALCYCNHYLTDGFVPEGAVTRLADFSEVISPSHQNEWGAGDTWNLVRTLVDAGIWKEVEDGYQIHDYLDYQFSRAEVMETREVRAEAGRLGGIASGEAKREAKAKQTLQQNTKQNKANLNPVPIPVPNPVPNPDPPKTLRAEAIASASEKPQAIPPSSKASGKATANIVNMRALWSAYFQDEPPPETDSARGKANKGFSELDRAGAKPEQMQVAKQNYCRRFPNMDINPMALAAHWHEVKPRASPTASDGRDPDGRDPGFWAEWQSMSYAEQIEHRDNYHEWCGESPTRLEEFEAWQTRYPLKPAPT